MTSAIVIDELRCKGCGLCISACPNQLISLSDTYSNQGYKVAVIDSSRQCTGCTLCAIMCPDVAICVFRD